MKLAIIIFFVGAVLAGIDLRIMMAMADQEEKKPLELQAQGWTPKLIIINMLMVIFVSIMVTGLVIVFMHKWWLALILLGFVMPFVVGVVSGERA